MIWQLRPEDGKMFAVGDPFSSVLYTIDTNTAQATLVNGIAGNSFTVNNAYGLAFGPAVPEPSGFSLLLVTTWLSGIGRRLRSTKPLKSTKRCTADWAHRGVMNTGSCANV